MVKIFIMDWIPHVEPTHLDGGLANQKERVGAFASTSAFFIPATEATSAVANNANLWRVGEYVQLKALKSGLDVHHVGQGALMKRFIPGYSYKTAPAILVPRVGHTVGQGVVSRNLAGIKNARQLLARDVLELRRVYKPQGIPNSALKELIKMNKQMYPQAFIK